MLSISKSLFKITLFNLYILQFVHFDEFAIEDKLKSLINMLKTKHVIKHFKRFYKKFTSNTWVTAERLESDMQ